MRTKIVTSLKFQGVNLNLDTINLNSVTQIKKIILNKQIFKNYFKWLKQHSCNCKIYKVKTQTFHKSNTKTKPSETCKDTLKFSKYKILLTS